MVRYLVWWTLAFIETFLLRRIRLIIFVAEIKLMINLSVLAKRFATEILPESVQLVLARRHYLRIVASTTEASEIYFSIISHLILREDLVMDIGANIGEYAKFMSGLVGSPGLVISVEPLPRNLAILEFVKHELGLNNVKIIRCAISEKDGRAELSIPTYNTGVENYYRACLGGASGLRKVDVETRSIDSLMVGQTKRVSFIKIDVEGHELPCVRGAMVTLKRDQPSLLIEVSKDPDDPISSAANLFQLLGELGYQPYAWDKQKVRLRARGEHQGDYFFLTSDHVALLNSKGLVIQTHVPCQNSL